MTLAELQRYKPAVADWKLAAAEEDGRYRPLCNFLADITRARMAGEAPASLSQEAYLRTIENAQAYEREVLLSGSGDYCLALVYALRSPDGGAR